jgi:G:T-mismatch repair DNA endonuclease (very short patch repair protein)
MKYPDINELLGRNSFNKFLKDNYFEFYQYLLNNYPRDLSIPQRLYWYYHNITTHPICPVCGNKLKFYSFKKGYQMFCSLKCMSGSEYKKNKVKQTCLGKYGVEHSFQSNIIKDKIKETNLEKYGKTHYNNRNKAKQTCLEKYGVEYSFQSNIIKDKIKETNLEKYGVEYYSQSQDRQSRHDEIQNKFKQTCLEKYGVENPFQSNIIKDKIKETNLEKYGVENPFQSNIIKDRIKKNNLEKYCSEYYIQSQEFKNKSKQTNLERYGAKHYTQSKEGRAILSSILNSEEVRNKAKQTCLDKYGSEYYTQSKDYQSRHDEIQTKINDTKHQNHTFNSSEIESLFSKYLDSQNIEYKRQYRSKEYPFNCDFYLPKYDLYIEIQASWTHGGHPYNEESDKDILESWKSKDTDYYKAAIETWTVRDVKKREIAKQNHLKYLEIFSNDVDEVIKCFEKLIN